MKLVQLIQFNNSFDFNFSPILVKKKLKRHVSSNIKMKRNLKEH